MKTLLLTIVVLLHNQPREDYTVQVHEPGAALATSLATKDQVCQQWAEQVLEGLQWGPKFGAALLPGDRNSIHYKIESCETEI